jgi:hypothetical protein
LLCWIRIRIRVFSSKVGFVECFCNTAYTTETETNLQVCSSKVRFLWFWPKVWMEYKVGRWGGGGGDFLKNKFIRPAVDGVKSVTRL